MASTLVQYLPAPAIHRYYFTPYTQGSVSAFATQFNTDWASVLPAGGAISIAGKTGAATTAEIVISPGLVLEVPPLAVVGLNYGQWQVVLPANLGRSVADGVTASSTTVTSATAAFTSADVGAIIAGPGIPGGATIVTVGSGTSVTISVAATATASALPLTITPVTASFTPDLI
jgi:hypothetical protein